MRRSIPILALLASAPVWAQTAPLRLSELRPNQGAVGTSVSLTANGAGFVSGFVGSAANIPGSTLIWRRNNQEVRLATNVVSTTTLTTTIPASLMINAPAVVDIIVENGNANSCDGPCPRSNPLPFTILGPQLQLLTLAPNRAPTRADTGTPQDFVLNGQGFAANTQVFWQPVAGGFLAELEVLGRTSSTTIQARIPATLLTQPAAIGVFVSNPGNSEFPTVASNLLPFTVFQALRLDRLTPASLPAGSPSTRVIASGAGYTETTRIGFRDAGGTRTPTIQVVNVQAGTIDVTVGPDLLITQKTWQVVAQDVGFTSEPIPFQVTGGLTISSLSPNTRAAGSGQFELTVNGSGFTDDAVVLFGSTSLTPLARTSTQLRVNVTAPDAPGPVNVSVRTGTGLNTSTSNSLPLTFTAPAPAISSLSPASRPANSGDFDLTINGTNLTPSPAVTFGGQAVTIIGTPTATSVTVRVANVRIQQVGNVTVVVRVNNVDSNGSIFQVTSPAPVISALSPVSRAADSGDFDLTITGANFTPNPSVTFGGQAVEINGTPTATSIPVRVPNARIQLVGNAAVVVRVNNVDSNAFNFQVTAPAGPTISSLNPASRTAGAGDFTLTINGQNLPPNSTVTFGGQNVAATTGTATSIQVQIPNARIQQAGPVEVRVQAGTLSAAATFTVLAPNIPAVTVSSTTADVPPNGNTTATLALAGPAPVPVTGALELTFAANAAGLPAGYADPALVFVSGGQKRLNFTIAQGQTAAQIPGGGAFNVGTVAGTVTMRVASMTAAGVDIASLPQPRTVTIPRAGPSITPGSARLVNSTGGVTVEVQGFSPTRDITQVSVTFTIAAGVTSAGSTTFTVPLQPAFTTWFASQAGRDNGSRFLLQIPFTVAEGDVNQITGFSITLSSPDGSPATATGGR